MERARRALHLFALEIDATRLTDLAVNGKPPVNPDDWSFVYHPERRVGAVTPPRHYSYSREISILHSVISVPWPLPKQANSVEEE